jgi:hypothetical protein
LDKKNNLYVILFSNKILQILEKALELKGILKNCENYWLNESTEKTQNILFETKGNKERKSFNSEIRNSISSNSDLCILNSTYTNTHNSDYNINDVMKDSFLENKNDVFSSIDLFKNLVLNINKSEQNSCK